MSRRHVISTATGLFFCLLLSTGTVKADATYVNSSSYARTTNYLDPSPTGEGTVWEYALRSGIIMYNRGGTGWQYLEHPKDSSGNVLLVKNIAADNNRLFVLTTTNQLFWYVPKLDYADWVLNLCSVGCALKNSTWIKNQLDDVDACQYGDYVKSRHQEGTWTELVRFNGNGRLSEKNKAAPAFDNDTILDIAVGNWYRTVVSYYVLTKNPGDEPGGNLFFTDEEPLMWWWESISKKDDMVFDDNGLPVTSWKLKFQPTHKYPDPGFSLNASPLGEITDESRIDASNSVIAVSTRVKGTNDVKVSWIRFDYHHQPLFDLWPFMDWSENDWHSQVFPGGNPTQFAINTNGTYNPAKGQGPWRRPLAKFCFGNLFGSCVYKLNLDLHGALGSINRWDIYNYPTEVSVATSRTDATTYTVQPKPKRCPLFRWSKRLFKPCKIQAIGLVDNFIDGDITFDDAESIPVISSKTISMQPPIPDDYEFVNHATSWELASLTCQRHGRTLAMPKNPGDWPYFSALAADPVNHMWIGLKLDFENHNWIWEDGTPLDASVTNWGTGEPNNYGGNEEYVEVMASGRWNDLPSTWKLPYVCQ